MKIEQIGDAYPAVEIDEISSFKKLHENYDDDNNIYSSGQHHLSILKN